MQHRLLFFCFACNSSDNNSKKEPAQNDEMEKKPTITEKPFGTYEGKPVTEYTMTNVNGMQVGIINYGGAMTKIITPDKNGAMGDVITGFESLMGLHKEVFPILEHWLADMETVLQKVNLLWMVKNILLQKMTMATPCMAASKVSIKFIGTLRKCPVTAV